MRMHRATWRVESGDYTTDTSSYHMCDFIDATMRRRHRGTGCCSDGRKEAPPGGSTTLGYPDELHNAEKDSGRTPQRIAALDEGSQEPYWDGSWRALKIR